MSTLKHTRTLRLSPGPQMTTVWLIHSLHPGRRTFCFFITSHKIHVHILVITLVVPSARHLFENHRHFELCLARIPPCKPDWFLHITALPWDNYSLTAHFPPLHHIFHFACKYFELFVSKCGSNPCSSAVLISPPLSRSLGGKGVSQCVLQLLAPVVVKPCLDTELGNQHEL